MSDKDTGSSFAIGFIIGAIAGVAVGFLYAPKAGKETRALLKEKAEITQYFQKTWPPLLISS